MATIKGNILTFAGVTDVSDCRTAEQVMQKAGLDWDVQKGQAYVRMDGAADYYAGDNLASEQFFNGSNSFKPIPNAFATYRTDKNIPLGLVKERYTPVQNRDAFKFFNDAIGANSCSWFTAGCYGNGEKIFVSAKLGDSILVKGKDPIDNYLVFSTSHDGSSGVRIMLTPIRLVCFNKMSAAIRNADDYITIRHTQSVYSKISQAQEILGIARKKINLFEQMLDQMTKIKYNDKDSIELFCQVLMTDKELKELAYNGYTCDDLARRNWNAMESAKISTQKVNALTEMITYYHTGAGQQEYVGTGYGVYNAVNGYYSNCKSETGLKRMDTLLYGKDANQIKLAGDLILN